MAIPAPYKHDYCRIIIVMDGDGKPKEVYRKIESHVPRTCLDLVKIIVVDYELF